MNRNQIKARYEGIQTYLNKIGSDGCLFLSLCTIIEEINGKPADIVEIVQKSMRKGWLANDFTVKDSLALLDAFTGLRWKRVEVAKLANEVAGNEFTIEKWYNKRTGYTHFKRRFVDTLAASVTVKEGSIIQYYIYSYEKK